MEDYDTDDTDEIYRRKGVAPGPAISPPGSPAHSPTATTAQRCSPAQLTNDQGPGPPCIVNDDWLFSISAQPVSIHPAGFDGPILYGQAAMEQLAAIELGGFDGPGQHQIPNNSETMKEPEQEQPRRTRMCIVTGPSHPHQPKPTNTQAQVAQKSTAVDSDRGNFVIRREEYHSGTGRSRAVKPVAADRAAGCARVLVVEAGDKGVVSPEHQCAHSLLAGALMPQIKDNTAACDTAAVVDDMLKAFQRQEMNVQRFSRRHTLEMDGVDDGIHVERVAL